MHHFEWDPFMKWLHCIEHGKHQEAAHTAMLCLKFTNTLHCIHDELQVIIVALLHEGKEGDHWPY